MSFEELSRIASSLMNSCTSHRHSSGGHSSRSGHSGHSGDNAHTGSLGSLSSRSKRKVAIIIRNIDSGVHRGARETTVYDIYYTFKKLLDFCEGSIVEEELNRIWKIPLQVDEKEIKNIQKHISDISKLSDPKINVDIELQMST